jgi:hypothetical protein
MVKPLDVLSTRGHVESPLGALTDVLTVVLVEDGGPMMMAICQPGLALVDGPAR